jgi:hypothetical protein
MQEYFYLALIAGITEGAEVIVIPEVRIARTLTS